MHPLLRKSAGVACAAVGGWLAARAVLRHNRRFDFAGKTVLVTGGARGLGLVLSRRLVDAGARVVICSRTGSQLIAAAKELTLRGGDVMAFACDVCDQPQVQRMVAEIESQWGPIDVVFNVAGIIQVGPLDSMTVDDFRRSIDTHCFGPLHTTLAVLPGMRRRGWGRIVNIASLGGKRAVPHMLPYGAGKFALVGLSGGLRAELAQENILVTTVCPGLMRTGSPRNATFKGRHREEHAWFSIGDSLPVVSMDADRAAKQILTACRNGDAEVVLSGMGKLAAAMQTLAPNLSAELTSLMARMLPTMGGIGRASARGYQSQSRWSPSIFTTLGDQAAVRNNETSGADQAPSIQ